MWGACRVVAVMYRTGSAVVDYQVPYLLPYTWCNCCGVLVILCFIYGMYGTVCRRKKRAGVLFRAQFLGRPALVRS